MDPIIFMDISENRQDGPAVALHHVVAVVPVEWENLNYRTTVSLSSGGSVMTTLTVAEFLQRVNEVAGVSE